jgi:hypothetical protein
VFQRAKGFLFSPCSTAPFAYLRIGLAAVLLVKAGEEFEDFANIYGYRGMMEWGLSERLLPVGAPHLNWFNENLGAGSDQILYAFVFLYIVSLLGLLVGWQARVMALLAWFAHLTLSNTGTLGVYGVDTFANTALFYCVIMPVGESFSLDRKLGCLKGDHTPYARLFLRLLQIHLCFVYLSAGVEKAKGTQWWTGEAIWRSLMQPQFHVFDMSWLAGVPWVAALAAWGTLILEIGYCFFIWPKRIRRLWLLGTIGLHLGIASFLGLWFFAAILIVLNLSAFGSDLMSSRVERIIVRIRATIEDIKTPGGRWRISEHIPTPSPGENPRHASNPQISQSSSR